MGSFSSNTDDLDFDIELPPPNASRKCWLRDRGPRQSGQPSESDRAPGRSSPIAAQPFREFALGPDRARRASAIATMEYVGYRIHADVAVRVPRTLAPECLDTERKCVTIREGAKNTYRQRTIPLNAAAFESMTWILERWKRLGGSSDEHYILPHRPRGERADHWRETIPWILTEPTTSMNTAWQGIRKAARVPHFRI